MCFRLRYNLELRTNSALHISGYAPLPGPSFILLCWLFDILSSTTMWRLNTVVQTESFLMKTSYTEIDPHFQFQGPSRICSIFYQTLYSRVFKAHMKIKGFQDFQGAIRTLEYHQKTKSFEEGRSYSITEPPNYKLHISHLFDNSNA